MNNPVVIVDDMDPAPDLIRAFFKRANVDNVITFDSPTQALQAFEHGLSPSVLISDFRMPEMNGVELIEAVKQMHPELFCIIITGDPNAVASYSCEFTVLEKGSSDFFKNLIKIVSLYLETLNEATIGDVTTK